MAMKTQLESADIYSGNSFGKTRIKSNVFTYTWVIENYIDCKSYEPGTFLRSPDFNVQNNGNMHKFELRAYPTGIDINYANKFALYLQRIETTLEENEKIYASIQLSIMNNTCNEVSSIQNKKIQKDTIWIFETEYFMKTDEVYNNCIINGNLTLKCIIKFNNGYSRNSYEYFETSLKNSQITLSKDLSSLMDLPKFSDVKIVIGERIFQVHKSILASRSPVFSAMLESPMKEGMENVIKIKDIEPEIMSELLRFIYTGQVNGIDKIAADLLLAADMYQVDFLRTMCEEALAKSLSLKNAIEILQIINQHDTCHLLRKCTLEFLTDYGKEVANLENFDKIMEQFSPSLLVQITKAALQK